MRDLVPFNYCITVFYNQNPFFVIFVNFIVVDDGMSHFLHFYSCLSVEAYHVIVDYRAIVVLSHD